MHEDDDAAANHDDDEAAAEEENNTARHQRKVVAPLRWQLTEDETERVEAMKKRYREIRAKSGQDCVQSCNLAGVNMGTA